MLNFQWNDFFVRDYVVDKEMQEHLWERYQEQLSEGKFSRASVTGKRRYSEVRFCDHAPIKHRMDGPLFDLSCELKDLAVELCDNLPEDLWFAQYEFVKYEGNGQTFKPHRDDDVMSIGHNRILTSVTMVERTDDMVGGHLHIWPTNIYEEMPNVQKYVIDLEPWETVIFPACFYHEASPVLEGRRTILISWAQNGA